MSISMRKRAATVLTTAAIVVGGTMTVGAGTAAAASAPPNAKFYYNNLGGGMYSIIGYSGNKVVGSGYWHANGDRLEAVDPSPDGYGFAAYLGTSPVREASTYGHNAPHTVSKSGNLPEGKKYRFWVCMGGSGGQVCSDTMTVAA
ncbi:hypothetical protein J7E91_07610 [Streptomyces sp. ISL-99]|uniref:hypothetical protein n=1 Tax=Streptomyces sp. ISL-99 TaxID=2819193 RepID=UPI001BECA369|nr:hypothetical protein [Streptomyces sp. ISL-99]MBT2525305.1 hypothetical protein [Streptomyces sp. ISL-99]